MGLLQSTDISKKKSEQEQNKDQSHEFIDLIASRKISHDINCLFCSFCNKYGNHKSKDHICIVCKGVGMKVSYLRLSGPGRGKSQIK